jgi:hypothetical protein
VLPKSLLSARISIAFSLGNLLAPLNKQGYKLIPHLTVVHMFCCCGLSCREAVLSGFYRF